MFPEPRQKSVDALAAYEDRLGDLPNPSLIFHGREDRIIPPESSQKLFSILQHAQLHMFSHCGHWTQTEHATTFNRLVRDFLTGDAQ